MNALYSAFNWIFGCTLLLTGLLSLTTSFAASICLISASAMLIPAARKFVYEKTNKEVSKNTRILTVLILIFSSGFFLGDAQKEKKIALAEKQRNEEIQRLERAKNENLAKFSAHRKQIISEISEMLSKGNYKSAIAEAEKYISAGDQELKSIYLLAKNKENEAITDTLLAELKKIPETQLEENLKRYKKLLEINPDREDYRKKVSYYAKKIEEKTKEEQLAIVRKKKIEAQFSGWDGSHVNLERYIKDAMNDPDSYSHVETVYWDQGDHLIVLTTFRGKNAFGGLVKNSVKAKVSINGEVLQIIE